MDYRRALIFGVLVCLASWFALAETAGNVGLQQSVTRYQLDPVGFLAIYPLAVALSLGTAFVVAFVFARGTHAPKAFALHGAVAVLLGDLVASFIVAPVVIGELEIWHGPLGKGVLRGAARGRVEELTAAFRCARRGPGSHGRGSRRGPSAPPAL